jgi:tetratricopeptide (TPR) repeat protein
MITTRHMNLEVELVRWLLLTVAAVALALAAARVLGAADPMEPQLLPKNMDELAKPLVPAEALRPFFPETPPARKLTPVEAAVRLWTILEHQRAGRVEEAIEGWEQVRLPEMTAHFREVAMGVAYLRAGDVDRALEHLQTARRMAPDHPVVAYFMGIARLAQAAAADHVPDRTFDANLRLVAFGPMADKAMYEMLATNELRRAIERVADLRLDERLLETDMLMEETVVAPQVRDLLQALRADNFVGQAHHLLFALQLERGELVAAELNLDAAAATGLATLYGYQDLAEGYLQMDRPTDAIRVLKKDLEANHLWILQGFERMAEAAAENGEWVW